MAHNIVEMIYHWCSQQAWDQVEDSYEPPSLVEEGFIHFSFEEQVARTATIFDHGKQDLVLLCVDESGLNLVIEDSYGAGEEFPHLYSPLDRKAVVKVVPFPAEIDGSFRLPPDVPTT